MIPRQALAAVPGSGAGHAPRITALAGGLVNRAFRIETSAGVFVLRLNAPPRQSALLGVDRRIEVAAQRLAAAVGLAPRLIAVSPDYAFQVCEFVAGETAGARDLASPSGLSRLGATLRGLRALQAPDDLRGADLFARTRRLVGLAAAHAPGAAPALHAAEAAAEAGWIAAGRGRRPCLVHSDPNPGNVVLAAGAGPAVLLDWEYAHVGDPLQDPAAWLQACPALRGREVELLRACGLDGEADPGMLAGMAAVYGALGFAWSRLVESAAGVAPDGRAN
jgi:aminoglycoside phosphotransferase (APT) family kinase protein